MPPIVIAAGIGAVAAGASAYASYKASQNQADATRKAVESSSARMASAGEQGRQIIGDAAVKAKEEINSYLDSARNALARGDKKAAAAYQTKADDAQGKLAAGYGAARSTLAPVASLAHYADDAMTGAGFTTSPGYQFRLDQGNQALARKAAASGGRISGAALKALDQYNQDFASNEFGNWANRALQVGSIGANATGNIANLYATEGAQRGNVDMATGNYLGNLYQNEGTQFANMDIARGGQLASITQNSAAGQANSLNNVAANTTNLTMAALPSMQQAAGAGWNAAGQFAGSLGQLSMFGVGGYGGGSGGWALPYDAQLTQQGANNSNLAQYYGTPNVPQGYYR